MHFEDLMENVVKAFEVTGVVILTVGSILAFIHASAELRRGAPGRRTKSLVEASAGRSCSDWRSSSSPTSS